MLTHIHIKDFAIIDNLDLELDSGLTVLTGETGAGKSILVDALEITLGGRADSHIIRHGAEKCEITLSFDVSHIPAAKQWLQQHELNTDHDCIIRRIINNDGRSRSTINGGTCTLQMVRELGPLLVNIHGQHEHQALLKKDQQRELLDDFAGHQSLCETVQKIYQQWRIAKNDLEKLQMATRDRQARLELLRFQVQELEQLGLGDDEIATLDQEHKKLANAEQLLQNCHAAINLITENESGNALHLLHQASQQLEQVKNFDPKIQNVTQLLNEAIIQTEEASSELRDYLDSLEINTERLNWIEQRLGQIHQLARKHRLSPNELIPLTKTLQTELTQLEHADDHANTIQQKISQCEIEYDQFAKQLSASRNKAAKKLAEQVTAKMQKLGMQGGKFAINFESITDGLNAHGLERVEFMVSANLGQPLHPLNKVASGGELSRIGLAIQVITAQKDNASTLIFDEVDVGIGGGTAEIVGKLLQNLGEKAQVLCITHLPQVAAQGHHHLQVKKQTTKNITQTQITKLTDEEKINEIARMLGGVKISEQTLAHAREMCKL